LFSRPLTFKKSSCSNASSASSTLSHIFASIWPQRSARVSARYGSPVFLGFTCFVVTTKLETTILFSKRAQSERKKSFIGPHRYRQGIPCCRKLNLKHAQFLLLFLEFLRARFF